MSAAHDTADVIVIGGGGAGLTAAAHAAAEGARVIVLEKTLHPGGSTGLSVGSFTAARTTYQRRAGVEDTVADFIADMATANGDLESRENTELRELLARESGPAFEWLAALGVGFLGPTPEPPFRLPRMHNVMPHSGVYIAALVRECRRRGVQIVPNARVDALLTGEDGQVLGARASVRRYRARQGVILATGDYSAAADLKARFVHPDAAAVPPINTAATGDGHRLGTAAGGKLTQMDRLAEGLRFSPLPRSGLVARLPASRATSGLLAWGARQAPRLTARVARGALTSWMAPSAAMFEHGAILVSRHGRRLADESAESAQARATARSGGPAYLLFDHTVAERFSGWPHPVSTFPGVAYAYLPDYRRLRPDVYHEARSLTGLAARIGAEPGVLNDTIHRWNRAVADDRDPEFGRRPPGRGIENPPFYALGPLHPFVTLADGGLDVDTDLRVLRPDGSAIPGLRAAGSAGQRGLQLVNHGLHIAWAVVSGRRRDSGRTRPRPRRAAASARTTFSRAGTPRQLRRPLSSHHLRSAMQNVTELMDRLTTPSDALIEDMARLDGDLIVLGVGGKVGPTLAIRAARAIQAAGTDATVYGAARFSDRSVAETLERSGVVPVTADLTNDAQIEGLPDAGNVVFMAGHKFGTTGNEHHTWMMNSYLPGRVAQRYPAARTVAFSTLLVYPMAPVIEGGSRETDPPGPHGEYAASCVGRERVYEHFARKNGTPLALFRLGYAIETRYGVLAEIAQAVKDGTPIDLSMGHASVIWQGDAAEYALRSLHLADTPPVAINATGPELVSVRWLAHRFAERLGREPVFAGVEQPTSYVLDGSAAHEAFGYPHTTLPQMIDWVADWVAADAGSIGKPTKFQERGGKF